MRSKVDFSFASYEFIAACKIGGSNRLNGLQLRHDDVLPHDAAQCYHQLGHLCVAAQHLYVFEMQTNVPSQPFVLSKIAWVPHIEVAGLEGLLELIGWPRSPPQARRGVWTAHHVCGEDWLSLLSRCLVCVEAW
eukprot:2089878-Amphidinium_carterae.1